MSNPWKCKNEMGILNTILEIQNTNRKFKMNYWKSINQLFGNVLKRFGNVTTWF
jgi:hypothetical protein